MTHFLRLGPLRPHTRVAVSLVLLFSTAEAHDWILSEPGENCDDACSGSCNVEGISQLQSEERLRFVGSLLDIHCDHFFEGVIFGNEPSSYTSSGGRYCIHIGPGEESEVSCNVSFGSERKYCCCGSDCPVSDLPQHGWVLSQPGDSCSNACLGEGGSCNIDATLDLNTQEKQEYVSSLLGRDCDEFIGGTVFRNEPSFYTSGGTGYCLHPLAEETAKSTCEEGFGREQRFCCCRNECPTSG